MEVFLVFHNLLRVRVENETVHLFWIHVIACAQVLKNYVRYADRTRANICTGSTGVGTSDAQITVL